MPGFQLDERRWSRNGGGGTYGGGNGSSFGGGGGGAAGNIPDGFLCPIFQEIMADPVTTSDGHTYERKAIEEWLRRQQTSPLTGLALPVLTLTPNIGLRKAITAFREQAPELDRQLFQHIPARDWESLIDAFERDTEKSSNRVARLLRENRSLRCNIESLKAQVKTQAKNLKIERRSRAQESRLSLLHIEALTGQLRAAGIEPVPPPDPPPDPMAAFATPDTDVSSRSVSPSPAGRQAAAGEASPLQTRRVRPGRDMTAASSPSPGGGAGAQEGGSQSSSFPGVGGGPAASQRRGPPSSTAPPPQPPQPEPAPAAAATRPQPAPPPEADAVAQWLTGSWTYNVFKTKAKVEITRTNDGGLELSETQPSGYKCFGVLRKDETWFVGEVVYSDGLKALRRIQRAGSPRDAEAIVSWKRPDDEVWTNSIYCQRTRQQEQQQQQRGLSIPFQGGVGLLIGSVSPRRWSG